MPTPGQPLQDPWHRSEGQLLHTNHNTVLVLRHIITPRQSLLNHRTEEQNEPRAE